MSLLAAVQMASGPKVSANLGEAERLIGNAVAQGARLVVLPENFGFMGLHEPDKLRVREAPGEGPMQAFLASQARRHGIWLVGGTVPLDCGAPDKVRAACLVYDDQGSQVARYDKVHLFDVSLSREEQYQESKTIEPGDQATVLDTPFGRLGLAVCYDLRFPEQFRCLLDRGMQILAMPAAFTAATGRAHWKPLVRARAIENLCYVIAADQGGYHVNGRETHGYSMIVDPWGTIVARKPRGAGVIVADCDPDQVKALRKRFPATAHRRFICGHS